MLAGDADRERAVHVLKEAFTEGRLTLDEYEDRVGQAYQARTYGELDVITEDIPRPAPLPPPGPPVPLTFRPYPYQPLPPPPRTNGKAVASLVCSLAGWPFCGIGSVLGVVLGHLARKEIRERGDTGDGLATGGLALGYLSLAFWVLYFIVLAS